MNKINLEEFDRFKRMSMDEIETAPANFCKQDYSYEQLKKIPVNHNDMINFIDNQNIIFYNIYYSPDEFFRKLSRLDRNVILYSGHYDIEIDSRLASMLPENVIMWYAQNVNIKHQRIAAVPIGIPNYSICKDVKAKAWMVSLYKLKIILNYWNQKYNYEKDQLILSTINTGTNPRVRVPVVNICESLDYCVNTGYLYFHNFYDNILRSRSVVCPRGNGIDTHRTWEALCLRSIPILLDDTIAMNYFYEYPIVFLDDWDELRDKRHIIKKIEEQEEKFKSFNMEKLTCWYWIEKMINSSKGDINE